MKKTYLIAITIFIITSISTLACFLPNKCIFNKDVYCYDYYYSVEDNSVNLSVVLRPNNDNINFNLQIHNCNQIKRNLREDGLIEFDFICVPTRSDYKLKRLHDIWFPEFLDPCSYPISYSYDPTIHLYDGEEFITKGSFNIWRAKIPNYLGDLKTKRLLLNLIDKILPGVYLVLIIYLVYLSSKKRKKEKINKK